MSSLILTYYSYYSFTYGLSWSMSFFTRLRANKRILTIHVPHKCVLVTRIIRDYSISQTAGKQYAYSPNELLQMQNRKHYYANCKIQDDESNGIGRMACSSKVRATQTTCSGKTKVTKPDALEGAERNAKCSFSATRRRQS